MYQITTIFSESILEMCTSTRGLRLVVESYCDSLLMQVWVLWIQAVACPTMIRRSHVIYQQDLSGQGTMTTCISPPFFSPKKKKNQKSQNMLLVSVVKLLKEMRE